VSALRLLLICGSTRLGSSNALALQVMDELGEADVSTDRYDGLRDLPAFVPDAPPTPAVTDLLTRICNADAVVFSTPEYAGALPGSLKNLLDWTVGGGELYGKPVAWLDVANPGRGAGARAELRTVLGYVGAVIVEAACVHLDIDRSAMQAEAVASANREQLASAITALRAATTQAGAAV
jgi:NAD(P)H-dependent FMN reductase